MTNASATIHDSICQVRQQQPSKFHDKEKRDSLYYDKVRQHKRSLDQAKSNLNELFNDKTRKRDSFQIMAAHFENKRRLMRVSKNITDNDYQMGAKHEMIKMGVNLRFATTVKYWVASVIVNRRFGSFPYCR